MNSRTSVRTVRAIERILGGQWHECLLMILAPSHITARLKRTAWRKDAGGTLSLGSDSRAKAQAIPLSSMFHFQSCYSMSQLCNLTQMTFPLSALASFSTKWGLETPPQRAVVGRDEHFHSKLYKVHFFFYHCR